MSRTAFTVAPYEDAYEQAVLDLLSASLGGGPLGVRSPALFRWKHLANPFGRSHMLIALEAGTVIGLRAFMRWEFVSGDRLVRAVRAVDTATHPDHQGRGVFAHLTKTAVAELRPEVDLIFNTPNQRSGPGYLKMGWRAVGRVPVLVRVRRPIRFLTRARSARSPGGDGAPPDPDAPPASSILAGEAVDGMVEAHRPPPGRLSTLGHAAFLRWRYGDAPLDYRCIVDEHGGMARGVAFFRVRNRGRLREASVADLMAAEPSVARTLLRRVALAARVDHVTCTYPAGTSAGRAARRSGFLPVPWGPTLVVNPLRAGIDPDPTRMSSWNLSLGDLEVF
jgi:GNAT superfamily N-acetyltransferase